MPDSSLPETPPANPPDIPPGAGTGNEPTPPEYARPADVRAILSYMAGGFILVLGGWGLWKGNADWVKTASDAALAIIFFWFGRGIK